MRIETRDGSTERQVLISLITSGEVLSKLMPFWEERMFSATWSNLIGSWCMKHFRKYQEAPNRSIQQWFEEWAETNPDKSTVKLVESFLTSLSDEYELLAHGINPAFAGDLAGRYFNKVKVQNLVDDLQNALDVGEDEEKVGIRLSSFKFLGLTSEISFDPFSDEAVAEAFNTVDSDVLVRYPGALGEFFGDTFDRSSFVSFTGVTGRGKSFWLLDFAWRALQQNRKVLFLEAGDMTKKQLEKRLIARAMNHPHSSTSINGRWPCDVLYPKSITSNEGETTPSVEFRRRTYERPWTEVEAREAFAKIKKDKLFSDDSFIRVEIHPARALTIRGIEATVQNHIKNNWQPDILVIDYADLLAYLPNFEGRDAINENWINLRRLSVQYSLLTVTASQSDAESYHRATLGLSNFSDDRRKNDHVTAMIGINQTEAEKQVGVFRLNYTKRREGESLVSRCCYTAGCLAVSNPAVRSCW